jgi:predicted Zn-dependent peptidase
MGRSVFRFLSRQPDTPDDVVFDKFSEVAYRGQTIGRAILGTPERVKSFTPM